MPTPLSRRFRPGWIPTLVALGAVATLCALGTWQVRRYHWREARLAEHRERMELPPLPLERALADPEAALWRRATATGRLDTDESILVVRVPRGLREGARVLTPLRLSGREGAVVVDRGWVPDAEAGRFLDEAPPGNEVTVTGLVFPLALEGAEPGTAEEERERWLRFDPGRHAAPLQAQLPYRLLPVLLQAVPEPGADPEASLPIPDPAQPRSPVDHRTYAITWYGMAAIALATWVGLGIKQARDEDGAPGRTRAAE